jgi:ADP-dependent NAD(P)H-hydrate dehydratase
VVDSSGTVYINQTGNPAMAQGGMGDVLTGLVAAYTAQGYAKMEAAVYACYVHGKSGDELAKHNFNVTASEVAEYVPKIIKRFIES